jgi:hypothetical protein
MRGSAARESRRNSNVTPQREAGMKKWILIRALPSVQDAGDAAKRLLGR